jgi:dUTP pyrophosphatase
MSNSYILKIYVEDPELKDAYRQHIDAHVKKITEQGRYGDSGFDLLVTRDINPEVNQNPIKIDMEICCAMFRNNSANDCCCSLQNCSHEPCPYYSYPRSSPLHVCSLVPSAFYLYPRSSLYKSDLRLTNSIGLIDKGFRGHLAVVFDVVKPNTSISQYSRLLQICAPDLSPINNIELVDTLEELGETIRGGGGFGSTGR